MKKWWGHLIVVACLLAAAQYLMTRTQHPDRWSHWGFGDMQTMLAVRNWQQAGFWNLNFLWVPQGYAHVTHLIDTPKLNHHAHGVPDIIPGVDQRLRIYTHYPSWYAFPYGLLSKFGIYGKSIYQSVAVGISLLAVFFLFLFVKDIFHPILGIFVALRYMLNPLFISYCDSLANLPIDDLFRFMFLYAWCRQSQFPSSGNKLFAYLAFFGGVLTSYDSLFFMPAWAILYSALIHKRFPMGQIILLALIGFGALSIHFLQNAMYLGINKALIDWVAFFKLGAAPPVLESVFASIWQAMTDRLFRFGTAMEGVFGIPLWQVGFILCLFFGITQWCIGEEGKKIQVHALLLLVAGALYLLVFPHKAAQRYQFRQFLPFLALVNGTLIYATFLMLYRSFTSPLNDWINRPALKRYSALILLIPAFASYKIAYTDPIRESLDLKPKSKIARKEKIFLNHIRKQVPEEKVVYEIGNILSALRPHGHHPQVFPLVEVLLDGPVLSVPTIEMALDEIGYLWDRRDKHFSPIIVIPEKELSTLKEQVLDSTFELMPIPAPPYGNLVAVKLTPRTS